MTTLPSKFCEFDIFLPFRLRARISSPRQIAFSKDERDSPIKTFQDGFPILKSGLSLCIVFGLAGQVASVTINLLSDTHRLSLRGRKNARAVCDKDCC